LFTEFF